MHLSDDDAVDENDDGNDGHDDNDDNDGDDDNDNDSENRRNRMLQDMMGDGWRRAEAAVIGYGLLQRFSWRWEEESSLRRESPASILTVVKCWP